MKHNKKRNCGLLYEFLTRNVAEALVDDDRPRVNRSVRVLKRFFREGTELHREFRLFKALLDTHVTARDTARRIVESARAAAASHDVGQLDREKSLLIRSINHTLNDPGFYDRRVESYRTLATVQMLLDESRNPGRGDLVRIAMLEDELVEHLLKPKPNNILDESRMDVDDVVVNLMMKRIRTKYDGLLNEQQVALMNGYVFALKSGDVSGIKASIEGLRESTLGLIDAYSKEQQGNAPLVERLQEVRSLISDPVAEVDDRVLSKYLRIARLKQEIEGV